MNIYLAGSSKDMQRCERLIAQIRALGHTITFDWCAHIRSNPGGANEGSDEVMEKAAELCLKGALEAELVFVANPPVDKPTAGAWGEMIGAIVAARLGSGYPRVIISKPEGPMQFCIFQHLRGVQRFENDDQALIYLAHLLPRPDDRSPVGS